MDYIRLYAQNVEETKNLLKEWIKLYPHSFNPDVEFNIYQISDNEVIIRLHEDLSTLAVSLLILYFHSTLNGQQPSPTAIVNSHRQQPSPTAYITIDDTEVLLKQNLGKRAMIFCDKQETDAQQPVAKVQILLEDNYCLDFTFEKSPKPVKDSQLQFEEEEFSLSDDYVTLRVGDVIKKKIDEVIEPEGLTPKKLMWYFICGLIGLTIGFTIVFFTT